MVSREWTAPWSLVVPCTTRRPYRRSGRQHPPPGPPPSRILVVNDGSTDQSAATPTMPGLCPGSRSPADSAALTAESSGARRVLHFRFGRCWTEQKLTQLDILGRLPTSRPNPHTRRMWRSSTGAGPDKTHLAGVELAEPGGCSHPALLFDRVGRFDETISLPRLGLVRACASEGSDGGPRQDYAAAAGTGAT
jgi:hypothetical protein